MPKRPEMIAKSNYAHNIKGLTIASHKYGLDAWGEPIILVYTKSTLVMGKMRKRYAV
jgi:hypothetical protein